MTPEEGYREAERRIEEALQEGATELDLSNLALTEVPESIGQLTQLEKLVLGGWSKDSQNQLTGLPDEIANLTQLQELNLSYNQFIGLPDAIANLTQLKELDLSENQLTGLPDAISKRSFSGSVAFRLGLVYCLWQMLPSPILQKILRPRQHLAKTYIM